MSTHEVRLIALGWGGLILFLTIFWYATLRRLGEVFKERLTQTRSRETSDFQGILRFLIRGDYKKTGDAKLIAVCGKLKNLLYGYLGVVIAYAVFIVLMRGRF